MGRNDWNSFAEGFARGFGDGGIARGMELGYRKKMYEKAEADRSERQQQVLAMQKLRLKQQEELSNIHLDATLGAKGYRRLPDNEAKAYMQELSRLGLPVANSGYIGLPDGATIDEENGVILDTEGNQIGSFLPGQAPKPVSNYIDKYDNGKYLRVGTTWYAHDEGLAKRMRGKDITTPESIDVNDLQAQMEKSGLKGRVLPDLIRDNKTGQRFKYYPTEEEKGGVLSGFSEESIQPAAQVTPPKSLRSAAEVKMMRTAVAKAMQNGAKREDLIKGIQSEGFKIEDFSRELYSYEPSVPELRRQVIGDTLRNVGVKPGASLGLLTSFSNQIDQIKKRLRK
jgi:hypothetical protein